MTTSSEQSRLGRFDLSYNSQINRLGEELRDFQSKYAELELEHSQFKEHVEKYLTASMDAFRKK